MNSHRYTPIGAVSLTAALFLASCGGSGDTATTDANAAPAGDNAPAQTTGQTTAQADAGSADTPEAAGESEAAPAGSSDFPNVDVLDVRTGDTVNLSSLAPRDKPALLWFYAPH